VITLKPQSVEFNGEELFLLEGKLSELQVAQSTEQLLAQLQSLSGVATGVASRAGTIVSSSALLFYEGEDTYNFTTLVDKKLTVCGTFKSAVTLENGEAVQFVVAKRGDLFYAHAAHRIQARTLLMPSATFNGDTAHFKSCMKTGRNIAFGLWAIFALFLLGRPFLMTALFIQTQKNSLRYCAFFCLHLSGSAWSIGPIPLLDL
jgi:hypothetical protein